MFCRFESCPAGAKGVYEGHTGVNVGCLRLFPGIAEVEGRAVLGQPGAHVGLPMRLRSAAVSAEVGREASR